MLIPSTGASLHWVPASLYASQTLIEVVQCTFADTLELAAQLGLAILDTQLALQLQTNNITHYWKS